MNTYYIQYTNKNPKQAWEHAKKAYIRNYPWGGDYRPESWAQVLYTDSALFLRLGTVEEAGCFRAELCGITPDACTDSCLEFFLTPLPKNDPRYVNLEFTPKGALYVGIGSDRASNTLLKDVNRDIFNIVPYCEEVKRRGQELIRWGISAQIPLTFLQMFFDLPSLSPGMAMRGNFYKCGDLTPKPHFGAWNHIACAEADFHRPEYFGALCLEAQ